MENTPSLSFLQVFTQNILRYLNVQYLPSYVDKV